MNASDAKDLEEQLARYEQHFNKMQNILRAFASTWMMGGATGIALLLRYGGVENWLMPPQFVGVATCFFVANGLVALFVLDVFVYQQMVSSVFIVGLKLEYDQPAVLPTRTMLAHSFRRRGASVWIRSFYLFPIVALLLIACLFVVDLAAAEMRSPMRYQYMAILIVAALLAEACYLYWRSSANLSFIQRADAFGNADFANMVNSGDYGRVLSRHQLSRPGTSAE